MPIKVNPPPALRIPPKVNEDPELRAYFEQIGTILFQLWTRTGSGNDSVADNGIDAGIADDKASRALSLLTQYIQETGVDLSVTEAKTTQALQSLEGINQALTALALAPPVVSGTGTAVDDLTPPQVPMVTQTDGLDPAPLELIRHAYGSFYDTTTQTAAAINTAYAMTFNTTDLSYGAYVGSPTSRIYVVNDGVYNFQFSAQLDKTSGGVGLVYIWFRVNGVDVSNSAGQLRLQNNNAELLAAWNIILNVKAGDYFEIMWSVDDTSVVLLAQAAAAPVPAIPSVILTVTDNISTGSR
jgi:hypothetical protein